MHFFCENLIVSCLRHFFKNASGWSGDLFREVFRYTCSLTVQSTLHLHALFPVSLAFVLFQFNFIGDSCFPLMLRKYSAHFTYLHIFCADIHIIYLFVVFIYLSIVNLETVSDSIPLKVRIIGL